MFEITVAMPVYNVENFIRESILSVLNQSIDNIELLIVDDCGTDNSMTIVKDIANKYHGNKRIRIIKHKANKGLSEARNTAIKEALGKFIFFIDSDDFISNNCIESMYKVMETENVDFVNGSYVKTNDKGQKLGESIIVEKKTIKGSKEIKEFIFGNSKKYYLACAWNKLFKLCFLKNNDIWFVPGTYYEDNMFSLQSYMMANSCSYIPDITYFYRQREDSIMHIGQGAFSEKEIKDSSNVRRKEKDYLMNFSYCEHFEDVMLSLSVGCYYQAKAYKSHNFNNLFIKPYIESLLYIPISLEKIFKFKRNKFKHIYFWLLGKLPYYILQKLI